jgi:assimilatory nitrate reductase catalytic subunit
MRRICDAVAAGAVTPQEIGKLLRAGTNCGSCLPEIRGLLASRAAPAEAAI